MTADDECEEWVGWVDHKPGRIIRMTGRITRVGRPCAVCGLVVPERDEYPYPGHADGCALVVEWRERDPERA